MIRLIGRAPKDPYKRTTYGGKTFNWRTRAMLMELSMRLYGGYYELVVYQGSYNKGVGASGGTHDGGGAVDLSANDWFRKVTEGRNIGFAIWHRPTLPGVWEEHIHGIAIGDKETTAGWQIVDYKNHLNGLSDHAWDSFPHHPVVTFNYQAWRKRYNRKLRMEQLDWFDMADRADLKEVVDAAADRILKRVNEAFGNEKERDQAEAEAAAKRQANVVRRLKAIGEKLSTTATVEDVAAAKQELLEAIVDLTQAG